VSKVALKLWDAIEHGNIKIFMPFLRHIITRHKEMFALLTPCVKEGAELVMLLTKLVEKQLTDTIVKSFVVSVNPKSKYIASK
jgi:hypothetical protein